MKLNKFVAGFVAVAALFGAYRYGASLGSDWRDEYHLKNDLRGSVLYECESQFSDKTRNRDIYVDYGNQRVFYSNDVDIYYTTHNTTVTKGAISIDVMNNGYYVSLMTMDNGVTRIFLKSNAHIIDSLFCTAKE
ncbi:MULTISPECIES: hypothetical protein [Klebsiella]|uniref:hypothetical protein n=1 Tax=Klebsiella TaxID=570 RepID=UPI00115811F4|nr:hypothetical protein [Klebsiella pasteurii]QUE96831.1 hypothetical protein KCG39_01610 [Klebsiella pasteurii]VUS26946.1 hypothetical protein SB6414_00310 [Klebsiella pasteurii]